VIRALPRVIQKIPTAVYLVAGQGPEEPRLRVLARSLGMQDRVIFVGYVPGDKLVDHYNLADVYIMASREIGKEGDVEGFGITFLEAGACGLPVVGGRSGGIPDAILNEQTGLLVDPGDQDQIASALVRILADESYASRLGHGGRKRVVETLQWRHMAERCLRMEKECP
jgi:phosphatidylinositol alpha-1,6-mannosyltransferase